MKVPHVALETWKARVSRLEQNTAWESELVSDGEHSNVTEANNAVSRGIIEAPASTRAEGRTGQHRD